MSQSVNPAKQNIHQKNDKLYSFVFFWWYKNRWKQVLMVTSALFVVIPQRWITRIEWFQVLVRTDVLSFTMNKKTLKIVECFFLEMILKNVFEMCWSIFSFVLEIQWKWTDYHWYFNDMWAKSMEFLQCPNTNIFSKSSPAKSTRQFSMVFDS